MTFFSRREAVFICFILAVFFIIPTLGADSGSGSGSAPKGDDVLAMVGGAPVTRAKLESELKNFEPQMRQGQGKVDLKKFLSEVVDLTLLEQEAAKQPDLNTPEMQAEKHKLITIILSQTVLKDLVDQSASATPVADKKPETPPAPAEPNLFHVHQMTFKTNAEALQAKKEIEGGKSFQEVAKTGSTDPFKDRGGDRGFVKLGDVSPAVQGALKALKQDSLSEPIQEGPDSFMLLKFSEAQAEPAGADEAKDKAKDAKKAAFTAVLEDILKKMDAKIDEENAKFLAKPQLTPEEQDKPLLVIGSEAIKLSAILADLQQIPDFIRPQILNGDGLKDFVKQFAYREVMKRYVEKSFDELSKKYPQAVVMASRETSIKSFLNAKMKEVTISEDETKEFYSKNIAHFSRPEQMRAHHILVDTEEKAKAIMDRLGKNEKFEDIAKSESKCPSGKEGGDLGLFEKGKMVPEFEAALEKADIGKNIGPVKTQFGFHVIRLDEKKASGTASLEDTKEEIKSQILPRKQKETFEKVMKDLRAKYSVQEFPERL